MSKKIDPRCHIGEIHGVYTIADVLEEKDEYGHYIYKGVCNECGYEKFSHYGAFSGLKSSTNICNHVVLGGKYIKNIYWQNRRIGNIFKGMKRRCYSKSDNDYKNYGAKGIRICDEWLENPLSFETWAINNGYDNKLTIDRINCNGDYEPNNCRWITLQENSKNKPTTNFINVDGEIHTGREWAKKFGFSNRTINTYVNKYGMENVVEFIRRYMQNPGLKPKSKQSYYDLYMND